MRWLHIFNKEQDKINIEHRQEIESVKERLDTIESIDVIRDQLAVVQRNGD